MRTFSNTVSSGKISVIWNVRAMPSATRLCAESAVMSRPSNAIVPEDRREESADEIEERGLAGAVGSDDRAKLAFVDGQRHVAHGDQAAEAPADVPDLEHAHASLSRRMKPSKPRGKNSTIAMNSTPTNDIQLTVMLDR